MRIFTYAVYDRFAMNAVLEGRAEPEQYTRDEAIARAVELTGRDEGMVRYLMPQCDRGNRRFFLSANGPQKAALMGGGVIVQRLA